MTWSLLTLLERPYGWAWAALLGARLRASELDGAERWWGAVAPLVDVVAEHLMGWLPQQVHPVRHGTHGNSAFALSLAWQLREIAAVVPGGHGAVLRDAAEMMVEGVLPEITEGDFMATHWLVSFALLAQDGAT
jgi:hypothetical protein